MLALRLFVRRNLLISCIVMASALLHGFIIFYVNNKVESQSSIGDQVILLIEVDKPVEVTEPPVISQDESPIALKKEAEKKKVVKKHVQPTVKEGLKQNAPAPQKIEQASKEIKKESVSQKQKNDQRSGSDLDLSGKELSAQARYRQRVLKHLLNNMSSAPALGSAEVKLTLMSAGVAIKVVIELSSGTEEYKQWLKWRILGANPYPSFPSEFEQSSLILSFPISHHD